MAREIDSRAIFVIMRLGNHAAGKRRHEKDF